MTQQIEGVLEVDPTRGVVYFHSKQTGTTKLRISGLAIPTDWDTIDIGMTQGDTVSAVADPLKLKGTPRRKPRGKKI